LPGSVQVVGKGKVNGKGKAIALVGPASIRLTKTSPVR